MGATNARQNIDRTLPSTGAPADAGYVLNCDAARRVQLEFTGLAPPVGADGSVASGAAGLEVGVAGDVGVASDAQVVDEIQECIRRGFTYRATIVDSSGRTAHAEIQSVLDAG